MIVFSLIIKQLVLCVMHVKRPEVEASTTKTRWHWLRTEHCKPMGLCLRASSHCEESIDGAHQQINTLGG